MNVRLKYGFHGLEVDLPETAGFAGVLAPKEEPPIKNPGTVIARMLRKPISSPPLAEIVCGRDGNARDSAARQGDCGHGPSGPCMLPGQRARLHNPGAKTACIVISDITRPVPNAIILPPILKTLEENGIARENILILIATGTHRPNEGAEAEKLVEPEIARNYRLANHFCKRVEDMVLVGTIGRVGAGLRPAPTETRTDDGATSIPVFINRHYLDADLKILTGFIEPHMWAGFSGGRKAILPGISSIETVEYMHGPEMIAHDMTAYGVLDGNPFHEAALAIMEKAGADFIVNVTLNTSKQITGVFAGHPVAAHRRGCEFLAAQCIQTLDEPLDFIVTTNSGAPLDCNLYQTVKGMVAAAPGVKRGGVILIASACYEGIGNPDCEKVFDLVDTPERFLRRVMDKEFFIPDQWCAQEVYQVMRRNPTWIYTEGVPRQKLERYHFHSVDSVEKAVDELLARFGPRARWAVVPDGPMLILRAKGIGGTDTIGHKMGSDRITG